MEPPRLPGTALHLGAVGGVGRRARLPTRLRLPCHSTREEAARGSRDPQRVPLDGSIAPRMPTGPSPRASPSALCRRKKAEPCPPWLQHGGSRVSATPPLSWGRTPPLLTLRGDEPRPLCFPLACLPAQTPRARLREAQRRSPRLPAVATSPCGTPSLPAHPCSTPQGTHWFGFLCFGLVWSGLAVGPEPQPPPASRYPVLGQNSRRGQPDPEAPSGQTRGAAAARGHRPWSRQ